MIQQSVIATKNYQKTDDDDRGGRGGGRRQQQEEAGEVVRTVSSNWKWFLENHDSAILDDGVLEEDIINLLSDEKEQ